MSPAKELFLKCCERFDTKGILHFIDDGWGHMARKAGLASRN